MQKVLQVQICVQMGEERLALLLVALAAPES